MRSFLHGITQEWHYDAVLSSIEYWMARHWQAILYVTLLAMLGYLYLNTQEMLASYLENFDATQRPAASMTDPF